MVNFNSISVSFQNHISNLINYQDQTPLRKISTVALCILSVGIPLIIAYRTFSYCFAGTPTKTTTPTQPYSDLGNEALKFARQELQSDSSIKPAIFQSGYYDKKQTKQPTNSEIALLTTLSKKAGKGYFANEQELEKSSRYINLAFATSNLTLDDLEPFTQKIGKGFLNLLFREEKRTYTQALTKQDSYLYRTFFYLPLAYLNVRHPKGKSEEYINAFYKEGTSQYNWRMLYNEYCDRVRSYVAEEELEKADKRFVKWTRKDESLETFSLSTGTMPS